jgi:5'-nucleotidase
MTTRQAPTRLTAVAVVAVGLASGAAAVAGASAPPSSPPADTSATIATTAAASQPAGTEPADTASASTATAPLRILLTNDDGWDAEGITFTHAALVAAGHDVVIVAPAENQSGTGARISFSGPLELTQHAEGVFSVTATPADATELGLSIAFGGDVPDLVVSGSNDGQNIASVEVHSGTVGAAVTALNEGVPAIAVSTEVDMAGDGGRDFEGTADFVAEMVDALAANAAGGPLLPDGVGLNVNFPSVAGGGPAGVAITSTDQSFLDLTYNDIEVPAVGATVEISPGIAFDEPVDPEGDAAMLDADFVSITFIEGNYDATSDVDPAELDSIAAVLTAL